MSIMEFINVKKTNEVVKIKITIEYVGSSEYDFVLSPGNHYNYSSTNVPAIKYPHEHLIGESQDVVKMGKRNNNWSVQIINPSDKDIEYVFKIEWYQGEADTPIHVWPATEDKQKGTIGAHTDHILFSGKCQYQ